MGKQRGLDKMLKWSVRSISVVMVVLLAERSSQYVSPYYNVYPASTFPLHQFPYGSALPLYPHHFNVRGNSGSINARHQVPFTNSKVSPFLSSFLTRTGPHVPGYGSGVLIV